MKKVLLVDDEVEFRQILKEIILEHFEVSVLEASDGMEALNKLRNDEFSVVVTDLKMPKLTGAELLKSIQSNQNMYHIKMNSKAPKVIIVSGSIDSILAESINSKSGKVRAFSKPIERSDFVKELTPHLPIKKISA